MPARTPGDSAGPNPKEPRTTGGGVARPVLTVTRYGPPKCEALVGLRTIVGVSTRPSPAELRLGGAKGLDDGSPEAATALPTVGAAKSTTG